MIKKHKFGYDIAILCNIVLWYWDFAFMNLYLHYKNLHLTWRFWGNMVGDIRRVRFGCMYFFWSHQLVRMSLKAINVGIDCQFASIYWRKRLFESTEWLKLLIVFGKKMKNIIDMDFQVISSFISAQILLVFFKPQQFLYFMKWKHYNISKWIIGIFSTK